MLYVFIISLVIAIIIAAVKRTLYSSIYFLIVAGILLWLYAIFFLEAEWRYQLAGIAMLSIGVFLAHIWEELFREKEESK